jgi:hypothetical protein
MTNRKIGKSANLIAMHFWGLNCKMAVGLRVSDKKSRDDS